MAVITPPADWASAVSEGKRLYNQRHREAISRANRILMAVGPKHLLPNPDDGEDLATAIMVERYKLVDDLRNAEIQYYMAVTLRPVSKQRRQKIERGIKAAEYLKKLQKDERICITDDSGTGNLDPLYPIAMIDKWIYQLRARGRDRRSLESGQEYSVERLHVHKRSPFEWLTGVELPRIFEQHFHLEAKVERNPDRGAVPRPPEGPYMRFACRFLIEFGIRQRNGRPYSAEAIAKALTNARSGGSRRKG